MSKLCAESALLRVTVFFYFASSHDLYLGHIQEGSKVTCENFCPLSKQVLVGSFSL